QHVPGGDQDLSGEHDLSEAPGADVVLRPAAGVRAAVLERRALRPGEPLGSQSVHADALQGSRSRGLELRDPADRQELRRVTLSAESQLLALGGPGILTGAAQ